MYYVEKSHLYFDTKLSTEYKFFLTFYFWLVYLIKMGGYQKNLQLKVLGKRHMISLEPLNGLMSLTNPSPSKGESGDL